jgi:hypothetical protein
MTLPATARRPARGRKSRLTGTPARIAICIGAIAFLAAIVHALLSRSFQGPFVFDDELGYQKLAESFAATGHFALFGKQGLSYSPLYPLILSPLYRLGLSGTQAYEWSKVVNAVLMAVSVVPIYKIARFVLTPGRAVAATALSALAPLMLYSSLEMSENLAFPIAMFAIWAALVTIRSPDWGHDAIVLVLCLLGAAARLQLVVLLPAAFVAVVVESALRGPGIKAAVRGTFRQHWLLTVTTAGGVLLGIAAYAGTAVLSLTGQYSNQRSLPTPPPFTLLHLIAAHLAGIDMAVGVIPFAGTLTAAFLWVRGRSRVRPETTAFAALAASASSFLLVLVSFTAYQQASGTDLPRVHERYLIYVLPLFIVAMMATTAFGRSRFMMRVGLGAGLVAGLLPLAIPYDSDLNGTVAADTFGLSVFFAQGHNGQAAALQHAAYAALVYALSLGLIYALIRPNTVLLVAATAAILLFVSARAQALLNVGAHGATSHTLPVKRDWVDAAGPREGVAILEGAERRRRLDLASAETAFYNLSVSRLYFVCSSFLTSQFGERKVRIAGDGTLFEGATPLQARYLVAPEGAGVIGRIVAANEPGHLVLIEPEGGVVRISSAGKRAWRCPAPAS